MVGGSAAPATAALQAEQDSTAACRLAVPISYLITLQW